MCSGGLRGAVGQGRSGLSGTAGVARPRSLSAAGEARPAPAAQVSRVSASTGVQRTATTQGSNIYSQLYRYYIPSEKMVFSAGGGWNEWWRRAEFLRAMKGRMQADYTPEEAEVVCRIFNGDMSLMFYEKAVQELRENGTGFALSEDEAARLQEKYSDKLWIAKQGFYSRRKAAPPADFSANALWFATFSEREQNGCVRGGQEHVGSIYFDGGRIRLMHKNGPEVSRHKMNRILRVERRKPEPDRRKLSKKDDVLELARLVAQAKAQYPGEEALFEYEEGRRHPSRGYPKKIILNNSEIAQLYYVISRIDEIRASDDFRTEILVSAGNKLLVQFLRSDGRLRRELGYEGLI